MTKLSTNYATSAFLVRGLTAGGMVRGLTAGGMVRGLATVGMAGSMFLSTAALAQSSKTAPEPTPIPASGAQCLSCHGEDGRPELADVPIIAGQQPIYLANALRHYKSGERTGGQALVMQEMVKDLTDKDIEALAKWFGEQK